MLYLLCLLFCLSLDREFFHSMPSVASANTAWAFTASGTVLSDLDTPMSSGKSRLWQWVVRALHWGAQRSWVTGLRSHSQCEVVLGFRLRYLTLFALWGWCWTTGSPTCFTNALPLGCSPILGERYSGNILQEFLSPIDPGTVQKGESGLEEKSQHTPPWNTRAQLAYESLGKNKGSFDYMSAGKWHGQNSFTVSQISFRKKKMFLPSTKTIINLTEGWLIYSFLLKESR